MKKYTALFLILAITLVSFRSHTRSEWSLDNNHSQLNFSLSLFGISDISGSFVITNASISAPKDDFTDAVVTMVADAKTVDTDNDARDKHLRTADFFDADMYPEIKFRSSTFKKTGDSTYTISGELSFHGISKPATLVAVGSRTTHPVTKQALVGFRVKGIIKRSDYGISPESPDSMLSDAVQITANLQFIKK